MALRTIQSPGTEVQEVDASFNAATISGTFALVLGYASNGTPFEVVSVRSQEDIISNFGKPTNEAERYFYYHIKDIIDEQGNVIAIKLPYANIMDNYYKMTTLRLSNQKYKLFSSVTTIEDKNEEALYEWAKVQISRGFLIGNTISNSTELLQQTPEKFIGQQINKHNEVTTSAPNSQYSIALTNPALFSTSSYPVATLGTLGVRTSFNLSEAVLAHLFHYLTLNSPADYFTKIVNRDTELGNGEASHAYFNYAFGLNTGFAYPKDPTGFDYFTFESVTTADLDVLEETISKFTAGIKTLANVPQSYSKLTAGYSVAQQIQSILSSILSLTSEIQIPMAADDTGNVTVWATKPQLDSIIDSVTLKSKKAIDAFSQYYETLSTLAKTSTGTLINVSASHILSAVDDETDTYIDGQFNYVITPVTYDKLITVLKDDVTTALVDTEGTIEDAPWRWNVIIADNFNNSVAFNLPEVARAIINLDKYASTANETTVFKKIDLINYPNITSDSNIVHNLAYDALLAGDNDGFLSTIDNQDINMINNKEIENRIKSKDISLEDMFIIVNQQKSTISGANKDEAITVNIVDPVHAMVNQRIGMYDSTDLIKLVTSESSDFPANTIFTEKLFNKYTGNSVSQTMINYFPTLEYTFEGSGDINVDTQLNSFITIIVSSTVEDTQNNGAIKFNILEKFTGSINRSSRDKGTGQSNYIVDVVNESSRYIKVFETLNYDTLVNPNGQIINDGDWLFSTVQPTEFFSFSKEQSQKVISSGQLLTDMDTALQKVENINEQQIDVVLDAGLSTIAEFVNGNDEPVVFNPFQKMITIAESYTLSKPNVNAWRATCDKLATFCRSVRKDCSVCLCGPRHLVLDGKSKRLRKTMPTNTFGNTITPSAKYLTGINNNYAALELNWLSIFDQFSGQTFWSPSRIGGVYVRTDRVGNFWDAPAGVRRGTLLGCNDIAINPTQKEYGEIYPKAMNITLSFPQYGYVVWGQKTTQLASSAFDRVNVRRLFLRLERFCQQTADVYVMEPNNIFTRRAMLNQIDPEFAQVKSAGGLYDYMLICDETNNTPQVIDRNELRFKVLLKPTKTAEFIVLEFVALRTDATMSDFS